MKHPGLHWELIEWLAYTYNFSSHLIHINIKALEYIHDWDNRKGREGDLMRLLGHHRLNADIIGLLVLCLTAISAVYGIKSADENNITTLYIEHENFFDNFYEEFKILSKEEGF